MVFMLHYFFSVSVNTIYLQNISSTIVEAQVKSLNAFKQDLYKEIKECLNSKFDSANEINLSLHDKLIANTTELISENIPYLHNTVHHL